MRFSLIYEAQTDDESRAGDRKVFEDLVEQVVLADQLGFDVVWCVEHTSLSNYAHMSAPETFLAYIAGRTERIGLGHGVVCLPPMMNHPIKVAERIATLDILSKGRVHFGVGKGGSQQEAGAFGYELSTLQPMIDESMYLIPQFFVNEFVEHDGKYIKIPKRPVHPKPYQDPHPPMYMACTGDDSLPRAGSRGLGALVLGFGGPDEVARKNKLYREAFRNRKPEDQSASARPSMSRPCAPPWCWTTARRRARSASRASATSMNRWTAGTRAAPSPTRQAGART